MLSGSRISSLFQQRWIPSSDKLFLLRSRGKEYHLLRVALPTLHVQGGYFQRFQQNLRSATGEVVDSGYAFVHHIGSKEKPLETLETVGAFQKLPMVMPSADILSSALRKTRNVAATKGIANIAKRERNKGAKQLDALMKELAVPLRVYIERFPKKWDLHPYERSLIQLTFGNGSYEEVLKRVDDLRKKLLSVGKQHASLCAQSLSKREAEERLTEGLKKLEEVFELEKYAVDNLLKVAKVPRWTLVNHQMIAKAGSMIYRRKLFEPRSSVFSHTRWPRIVPVTFLRVIEFSGSAVCKLENFQSTFRPEESG